VSAGDHGGSPRAGGSRAGGSRAGGSGAGGGSQVGDGPGADQPVDGSAGDVRHAGAGVPALTEPVPALEPPVVVGAGEPAVPAVGARLGVDVGSVRVGVAVSDPHGVLATPLETLARDAAGGADLNRLADLVVAHGVVEVIVGLPRTLSGRSGPAAQAATAYATALAARIAPVPVRLSDERLTTVAATRTLSERGISSRKQRTVVDQAAAVLILQGWLDSARTGR
jgi:putative holliday junction resolvase